MLDPLALIAQKESSNQNIMQNLVPQSVSTAGGYYQITNTTWGGIPASITQGYPTAISAPQSVQQNAAAYLYNNYGFQPWTGQPNAYTSASFAGNQSLISAISAAGGEGAFIPPGQYSPGSSSATPSVSMDYSIANNNIPGLPGSGNDPVAGGGTVGSEIANPGVDIPGTGTVGNTIANPVTYGNYGTTASYTGSGGSYTSGASGTSAGTGTNAASSAATAAAGTSWFDWFTTELTDLLVRFGVVILGLILVGIAAFQFAKEQDIVPPIKVPPME